MFIAMILLIVGFVLLIKGADIFVEGASHLAYNFKIPQIVVGLTIVAMGTSLPEAAVSISAGIAGNAGITVGNVLGSNILNVLIILGISSLFASLKLEKNTMNIEIPFMLVVSVVLTIFGLNDGKIVLWEGIALWGLFLLYLYYLFLLTKKGSQDQEEQESLLSLPKCGLFIILGAICVILGSQAVVNGATTIAKTFGISDRVIGLTIVAFGTSLPELVTSVTATRKGNCAIAIGNIVGSNLFNILFVVGTTALILPIVFEASFIIDSLVMIVSGVILWLGCKQHLELRKPTGILMIVCYGIYFAYLCIR